jgi:HD-GYP domain-containing protein (c-di-GMP phosphodiesterase class II)
LSGGASGVITLTTKDSLNNDRNDIPAEHNITEINDGLIERILSYSDEELACKNLEDSLNLIERDSSLCEEEKEELKTFLWYLYKKAMPYFTKRAEANPAYHHTQVLYNMVRLALREKCNYKELRNLLILALLHDIGDAVCTHTRVVGSRIVGAFERAKSEKDEGKKAKLTEEATKL